MSSEWTSRWTKRMLAVALAMALGILVVPAGKALAQETVPEERTLYFELTIEGEPPAGTTFSAVAPGANITDLADPDGDGVYTGSLEADLRNYPRCIPVQVFGKPPGPPPLAPDEVSYPIRDETRFCFEDGDVFSASYSFKNGEGASASASASASPEASVPSEQQYVPKDTPPPEPGATLPATSGPALLPTIATAVLVGSGVVAGLVVLRRPRR